MHQVAAVQRKGHATAVRAASHGQLGRRDDIVALGVLVKQIVDGRVGVLRIVGRGKADDVRIIQIVRRQTHLVAAVALDGVDHAVAGVAYKTDVSRQLGRARVTEKDQISLNGLIARLARMILAIADEMIDPAGAVERGAQRVAENARQARAVGNEGRAPGVAVRLNAVAQLVNAAVVVVVLHVVARAAALAVAVRRAVAFVVAELAHGNHDDVRPLVSRQRQRLEVEIVAAVTERGRHIAVCRRDGGYVQRKQTRKRQQRAYNGISATPLRLDMAGAVFLFVGVHMDLLSCFCSAARTLALTARRRAPSIASPAQIVNSLQKSHQM
ncbi:MAG: hypothetical protein E7605_02175 [Ruminococcaceae bacterium]|nr:hypothetical protein [Oscillospiraceae bacterium]